MLSAGKAEGVETESAEEASPHRFHTCAMCQVLISRKARQAREWEERQPPWDLRRCPDCNFCCGRHAPDCFEARERVRLAQLGLDVD